MTLSETPVSRLFRQFRGKFAENSRKVRARVANAKEKKRKTGGFERGGAKLVIPDRSRGPGKITSVYFRLKRIEETGCRYPTTK